MPTPADRLFLFARTLSHLKAVQIAYLMRQRVLPTRSSRGKPKLPAQLRRGVAARTPFLVTARASGKHGEFRFLNVSKSFARGKVDWASPDQTRLWRYNLHYFDYILDPGRPVDHVSCLISDWIDSNPASRGTGWEPYPTSLRIANWIKLFLREDFSHHVQHAWIDSLYRQSLWLERNIEYHLLANHLLKNAKALLFAGTFFSGADAERWLHKGSQLLVSEAHEQILDDGGHFERSPMYHSIVIEDYLDSLNLMMGCSGSALPAETDFLVARTKAALDFLYDICQPDGNIPLFNDSARGIAPTLDGLLRYAHNLIDYTPAARPQGLLVSSHAPTGYFVMRHGDDLLVVDCGEVGPSYQPGHAHCDTLSFELTSNGRALIVDSGVYDYEDSEMRRYVRGTRAHNTAMIDGCEQSELWGVFRVARRARPIRAKIEKIDESRARFSGSHDGFVRLAGRPVHTRDIEYEAGGTWTVVDNFAGRGEHRLDTFVHLHPDLVVRRAGRVVLIADRNDGVVAEIQPLHGAELVLEEGWYCPEFGKKQENVVMRFSSTGPLPRTLGYRIAKRIPNSDRNCA